MANTQENQLVLDAQSGSRQAERQIIKKYERLVHKLSWKYGFTAASFTHEDLAQEGYIGLLSAIKSYDPTRGAKFMTWAYYHVRGAITSSGRVDRRQPKYPHSLEDCPRAYNIEDPTQTFEVKMDVSEGVIRKVIESSCGGLHTKRAKVVIDRFGLFGNKELRNCECVSKYGMTKYAVNAHVYAMKKKAAQKFPELEAFV
jgi:RNA polymerase sigma factor (sigma-70 family)